jgi:hypothetical protein
LEKLKEELVLQRYRLPNLNMIVNVFMVVKNVLIIYCKKCWIYCFNIFGYIVLIFFDNLL